MLDLTLVQYDCSLFTRVRKIKQLLELGTRVIGIDQADHWGCTPPHTRIRKIARPHGTPQRVPARPTCQAGLVAPPGNSRVRVT